MELADRDHEAEARELLLDELMRHDDEGVRASAALFGALSELTIGLAAALRAQEQDNG